MFIKSLSVANFRNYDIEFITFSPNTNIIYGNNAQGKTNLLEAVYLFSHGRSHRAKSDTEMIRFGKPFMKLSLEFSDSVRDYNAAMRLSSNGKKQIQINNVPITKLSMLMNYLNVVMFSPEDLELVKGSPSVRRRFMDEAVSQLYPNYLSHLISYHKALAQKNSLLKALRLTGAHADASLSVWNEQLAGHAAVIMRFRQEFLAAMDGLAAPVHAQISRENLKLLYTPNLDCGIIEEEGFAAAIYEKLEQRQAREIDAGSAQYGPQRDDFRLLINENDAKTYGSQGQQRTAVLSLKIAETEYIRHVKEEYPVLLLDDIMSELDVNRRMFLAEKIKNKQVLLTCTDSDLPAGTENASLFYVEGGKIKR